MIDLIDKKFMVTGASSGIGRATSVLLSKLGAKIVACGRNEQRLDETLAQCEGSDHIKLAFDVRDIASYKNIFGQATADGRKLDGLVYCAGIATPTPLRVMSEETIREVLDVNLISFMMMVATYAKKPFNNGGSIVAISSINAHYPHKCMSAYAASKLALEGAAKTLSLELADKNIRVNCVIAGPVQTEMVQAVLPTSAEQIIRHALLGVLEPEDVADSIVFLLSDASRRITGRAMYVDGGYLGQ
ncbi:MAG: SDR family oxidoreductase [Selenomonadaceae bacterium]|nr:SDR family oxidoreductase [Selenomonadaceae bacterium]